MMQSTKICPVCGKSFRCPPSSKTVTCSKACSSIHRSRVHVGKHNVWSADSRRRLSASGQTANLLRGTAAAKASPHAGAYTTNVSARHWILKAPDGQLHEFDNLNHFIRSHPDWFTNPHSASTALSAAATGKRNVGQYKGWQVIYRSRTINKYKEESHD